MKVYAPPYPLDDAAHTPIPQVTPTGRSRPAAGAGLTYLNRKLGAQERREWIQGRGPEDGG
ncbi:hypothetical protein [Streptomyces sp. NBC_00728]|uniref:hypothetical protein n=1 Tax=Streptomyces sp. NBC_00728 TaxID=2903676 RepID=UPI00386FEC7C